jgi:hypothetical protein
MKKPKAEKKAKSKLEWEDACMLMHTALRKCCDSKITSAAYNLIHLIKDTSEWSAWRMLGELVAEYVDEGEKPTFALTRAIEHLGGVFYERCAAAKQKDEDVPDGARTWLYALLRILECFNEQDVEGMAYYLGEDE